MPRAATAHRHGELDADASGIGRRPGEFARHPKTGAPYVASVDRLTDAGLKKAELIELCAKHSIEVPPKATVPQLKELLGDRAKRGSKVQYGRPSSLGKQVENTTNLQKWSERAEGLGLFLEPDLLAPLADVDPDKLNLDDPDTRDLLDEIAVKAKNRAQAGIAAERGTHGHELTEDHDNELDFVERITRGEDLGLPEPVQYALVAAWAKMLGQLDVEMLAVEARCVDDIWRQAGTLDRICRLKRDTRFPTTAGTYVTLPAGWVGILDIKTGKLRLDDAGFVSYWHGYAVQLASYAQSVPYDPDTDTRGEWPWPIDQRFAIIAHLDILAALAGEAKCRLVLVDLEAGRHAGALCVAAREWEKRTDVFSIPTDDLCVSVPVESSSAGSDHREGSERQGPAVEDTGNHGPAEEPTPCAHEWKQVGRCAHCDRCGLRFQGKAPTTPETAAAIAAVLDAAHHKIAEHGSGQPPAADAQPDPASADAGSTIAAPVDRRTAVEQHAAGEATPPVSPAAMSDDEIRAEYRALSGADKERVARMRDEHIATEARHGRLVSKRDATALALGWIRPFDHQIPAPEPAMPPAPVRPPTRPDEGGAVDEADLAPIRAAFKALDEQRQAWVDALVHQGRDAGVPWNMGGDTTAIRTVRRFELARAVLRLAATEQPLEDLGDELRGLAYSATDRGEFAQESIPLGAALGSLDAAEAARFARFVDDRLACRALVGAAT